jgi:preprotein translocase subunit SecA
VQDWAKEEGIAEDDVIKRLQDAADAHYAAKVQEYGPEVMRQAEKSLILQVLDHVWKDHLLHLDHLRQGIYLRGYGQKDPLNEYKREAFDLFDTMLSELRQTVTQVMMQVQIRMANAAPPEPPPAVQAAARAPAMAMAMAASAEDQESETAGVDSADPSTWGRVSRNAPCPCGSGKKFKACHGRFT